MRLPADGLVAFAAVAETKSVTRAARDLGLSQPAISNRLRNLQLLAGARLYRRTRDGIELLPAGEELLPHARAVARALERAARSVDRSATGVTVALSEAAAPRVTPLLVSAALSLGLELDLGECDAATAQARVLSGDADLAIAVAGVHPPEQAVERRPLGVDAIVLVASWSLPARLPLETVAGATLLWQARGSGVRATLERVMADRGVWPLATAEAGSSIGVLAAVAAGHGIGLLPRGFAEPWRRAGLVEVCDIDEPRFVARFEAVTAPADQLSPAVAAILDALGGDAA
jgi:DNA-binding transcriptional LysR family regulator